MKIFVTGGTGFVGREVVGQLLAAGHQVKCLVRAGSEGKLPSRDSLDIFFGDVREPTCLEGELEGCDAVIHLVGIIREFHRKGITFKKLHLEATRNVIDAAIEQGIKRYLHMSANGTRADGKAQYHKTKWQAEELVRESGLDWTIFRPSLVFGAGGEFVTMLADLIQKAPIIPVIGDGQYRMAPIAVADVANSFVKGLALPETIGQTYACCGPTSYTYEEILDLTARALGKDHVSKIHQPVVLIRTMVNLLESFASFPLTKDQMIMLLEGNVCDSADWTDLFDIRPISYAEGIADCY